MKNKRYSASKPLLVIVAILFLMPLLVQAAWYNSSWKYRKTITIDNTKVDATVSNFPVLINMTDTDLRDNAQSDGDDILFTSSNGTTKLSHEIEKFDSSTGELIAWVKVTSLSSSSDTVIYMYYGNSGASSQQDAENVWDSNYKGVWHLAESSSTRYDSTSNNNDLSTNGTVTATTSGKMAGAIDLEESSEGSLYIVDNASLSITGNLTISGWVKLESLPSVLVDDMHMVSKWDSGNESYCLYIEEELTNGAYNVGRFKLTSNGSSDRDADGDTALSTATWYYLVAVYNGTDQRAYRNGSLDSSSDNPSSHSAGIYDGTASFHIGRRSDDADEMDGLIDEVRVSNTDRDADWIATEYNNQNSPSTFYSVGDETPVIQFTATSSNGAESVTPANLELSLSGATGQNVTVDYAVTGGTATGSGTDYTLASGTATITAENTTTNISATIVDDTLYESNETIIVTISNPSNGVLGANTAHTYTINDNDSAPTIQFTSVSSEGPEGTAPADMQLVLSNPSFQNVSVNYAVTGGTATGSGEDYTLASGTAIITAGNTTEDISATIVDDSLDEANETIIVTISNPSNATLGTNTAHTYTINDNDSAPTIAFTATSSNGAESSTPANLELTLSAASGQNVTVDYSVTGGTATGSGTDYTLASGTATITAGNTTTNISATIVDDSLDEANETIIVTISNPSNATLGTNTEHTCTINDNEGTPTIQFSATSSNGAESSTPANLELTLSAASGQDVTVDYSVTGGTATGSGTDYTLASGTATITAGNTTTNVSATIVDDSSGESNETIEVTISNPSNATLGGNAVHTYTINDNDPSKLSFNQQPSNTAVGFTISPAVTVQIQDANNNVITSVTDNVTIAIANNAGGGTLSGTLTKAAVSGVATFNDLSIDRTGAGYTLTATSGSLTSDTSDAFTITQGAAGYFRVTGTASMTAGSTNELIITAYDAYSNVATGYTGSKSITFSGPSNASDGSVPTVEGTNIGSATTVNFTNGVSNSGAATLTAYKAETTTVDVTDGSISSTGNASYDLDLTVSASSAAAMSYVSGNNQSGTIGFILSNFFVVKVTDDYGNAVNGKTVNWSITTIPAFSIGQSLSSETTTSDSDGEAQTQLTLGNTTGTYQVQASANSVSGSPITFNATASSNEAQNITLVSGGCQSGSVNTVLTRPFVVKVTDSDGNAVSSVSVSWSVTTYPTDATGYSLSSETTTTDSDGEAQVTLTLGDKAGLYKVEASVSGLSGSPVSFTATTGIYFFVKGGSYRKFSIPYQMTSGNAESALNLLGPYDPFKWRLFRYNGSGYLEYPDTPDFSPGLGYWLISVEDKEIVISGTAITSDMTLTLEPGWSQVGCPFTCSVTWAAVMSANADLFNNNIISSTLWGYDADQLEFVLSTQLDPWQSYWIYNASDSQVTLIFPYQ